MYQVIARKYRPQTFQDVVNQEHVKDHPRKRHRAESHRARLHLFRAARHRQNHHGAHHGALPELHQWTHRHACGVCASCLEITSGGGTVDVIEIDAASNRGINEMRELRENVRYQPARDRYKIFIVDEAHQITNEAFNALLKTIEEPPPVGGIHPLHHGGAQDPRHHRIALPALQFSLGGFRRSDRRAWRGSAEQEGIEADPEALAVLAQAGEGSVRDSLSALDQAIACCGAKLNAAGVRALLGAFSLESLERVSQALADGDSLRMLEVVDELERNGHNLQHFARELARYLRNLLVARIAGADDARADRRLARAAAKHGGHRGAVFRRGPDALPAALRSIFSRICNPRCSRASIWRSDCVRLVQAGRLLPIEEALASLRRRIAAGAQPSGARQRRLPPTPVVKRNRGGHRPSSSIAPRRRHRGRPSRNLQAPTRSRRSLSPNFKQSLTPRLERATGASSCTRR